MNKSPQRGSFHIETQRKAVEEGNKTAEAAQEMIDRKGITDRVTLAGMTLMNWDVFLMPLKDSWVSGLTAKTASPAQIILFFRKMKALLRI